MFQFKINHHILYTRDKLLRAKIIENDECQLCGVSQTLEHLFVECRHVQSFWNLHVPWWNSCNLPKVALTNNAKIYAHHPEKRSFRAVNLCLIVARYYIYTAAKESESYSTKAFQALLKSKLSTEFKDAYITADYAKAIQDERRKLIKAMFKAKEQGSEAKVVGRYLYIGELKYDVTNVPEDFK